MEGKEKKDLIKEFSGRPGKMFLILIVFGGLFWLGSWNAWDVPFVKSTIFAIGALGLMYFVVKWVEDLEAKYRLRQIDAAIWVFCYHWMAAGANGATLMRYRSLIEELDADPTYDQMAAIRATKRSAAAALTAPAIRQC